MTTSRSFIFKMNKNFKKNVSFLHSMKYPNRLQSKCISIAIVTGIISCMPTLKCHSELNGRSSLYKSFGYHSGNNGKSSNNKNDLNDNQDDFIGRLIDKYGSEIAEISFGGALGFCSGIAIKQVGKALAATIGVIFFTAQLAASKGYIDINWKKIENDANDAFSSDKKGKLTKKDIRKKLLEFIKLLKYNLPSSSGFGIGFLIGFSC